MAWRWCELDAVAFTMPQSLQHPRLFRRSKSEIEQSPPRNRAARASIDLAAKTLKTLIETGAMIIINDAGEKEVVYFLGEKMEQIVEQVFRVTLENNGGNRVKTAKALGVHVRTIRNWVRKYKVHEWEFDSCPPNPQNILKPV